MRRSKKKPQKRKWTVVSFKQIEAWREAGGLTKKGAAELLGVTNSTWHNWAGGIAIPSQTSQRRFKGLITGNGNVTRAASNASDAARIQATGQIVVAFLDRRGTKVALDKLGEVVRGVKAALA